MSDIKPGDIVKVGFHNNKPSQQNVATDFINCKVIFKYTDFYKTAMYIVFPTEDITKYSNYFYAFDIGLITDVKMVYSDFEEISNIIDYIGMPTRVIGISDFKINKPTFYEDGCKCVKCKEFYPMAVPNQPNNTLICYSCRENPWR